MKNAVYIEEVESWGHDPATSIFFLFQIIDDIQQILHVFVNIWRLAVDCPPLHQDVLSQTKKEMPVFKVCSTSPLKDPLITSTILSFLARSNLSNITSPLHNSPTSSEQPPIRQQTRARHSRKIMHTFYLLHTLITAQLTPSFNWHSYLLNCQITYFGVATFWGISYLGILILFWAWRLESAFENTAWSLSKKFKTVLCLCVRVWTVHFVRAHTKCYWGHVLLWTVHCTFCHLGLITLKRVSFCWTEKWVDVLCPTSGGSFFSPFAILMMFVHVQHHVWVPHSYSLTLDSRTTSIQTLVAHSPHPRVWLADRYS